jgi:imidazolonepropionase-like amidohydrolase
MFRTALGMAAVAFAALASPPSPALADPALAFIHAKVYTSPDEAPLSDATVLVESGRITEVGKGLTIPSSARVLNCEGRPLMAGFWNCHVHLTQPQWEDAATTPADRLTGQFQAMFTRFGFTSVVDVGSNPFNTFPLRTRLRAGEVAGPALRSAGAPIYPAQGVPYYLGNLPAAVRAHMPQPATAEEARGIVDASGKEADLVKLFTGSWVARGKVKPMTLEVAKAAVEVAHRQGHLVFAHPSNLAGTRVALEAGVDVLAHAPDDTRGIDGPLLQAMVDRHMAMVPTLQLFHGVEGEDMGAIRALVKDFRARGGELLFGTDVGFIETYDPADEFLQLSQAGLKTADLLRMLTTAPSRRFGVEAQSGRVAKGMVADLVVLAADPERDPRAFARISWTVQAGIVRFEAGGAKP